MKKLFCILTLCTVTLLGYGQASKKFPPQKLKEDIAYLQQQVFDAHANPFTEFTKLQYERLFSSLNAQITDSLDITSFYKIIKPAFAYLSDEHSGINIDTIQLDNAYKGQAVFLPFSLIKQDDNYFVDQVLRPNSGFAKGDKILLINNVPVSKLVEQCAKYTTGFPDQRLNNALKQFGYLYTWSIAKPQQQYRITTAYGKQINIAGVTRKTWINYLFADAEAQNCTQPITYTRYGDAGYINSCTFMTHNDKEFKTLSAKIDSVFKMANDDKLKYLFIDVSHNGGGNSSVGDVIINDFYNKPYRSYQCNWRRSEEYLKLIRSWGSNNDFYAAKTVGSVIHFDADTIFPPINNPNRFTGKVYIIIGDGTFSSAMMFATIIKDNHIATIIGQTPQNGPPRSFRRVV